MKYLRLTLFFIAVCSLANCKQNRKGKSDKVNETKTTQQSLEWFKDAKFGMFIHWGLYAIPAGEWKGQEYKDLGEWIMQLAKIPADEYRELTDEFNPTGFDADRYAQLAKDAGANYVVITSKHHDGFSMFDSEYSDYDIVDATPYGKDPMMPLANAVRDRGLRFGFYYSHVLDWNEPNAYGNTWDFPEERDYNIYLQKKAMPQVHELLTNYGPIGMIWFDMPGELNSRYSKMLRDTVKSLSQGTLVNSRLGGGLGDYEQTGDNQIINNVYEDYWEICQKMNNSWGYKKMDDKWKPADYLLYNLVQTVSKGGNYLLNIGPDASGNIPQPSVDRLLAIGEWLDVNGASVYGTSPTPFYYDGNAWACTVKPGKLYFHLFDRHDTFHIRGLQNDVSKAYFLDDSTSHIPFKQSGSSVTFQVSEYSKPALHKVLVAEIEGTTPRVADQYRYDALRDTIALEVKNAYPAGYHFDFGPEQKTVTDFRPAQSWSAVRWATYLYHGGSFDVYAEYKTPNEKGGSEYLLIKGWHDDNPLTGIIEDTGGGFRTVKLGTIQLESSALQQLGFKLNPEGSKESVDLELKKLVLVRK